MWFASGFFGRPTAEKLNKNFIKIKYNNFFIDDFDLFMLWMEFIGGFDGGSAAVRGTGLGGDGVRVVLV